MDSKGAKICNRYKAMYAKHEHNRSFLNEIAFYFDPENSRYGQDTESNTVKHEKYQYKNLLYDTTCRDYKDELVDYTLGRIIDPSFAWLKLLPMDKSILTENSEDAYEIKRGISQLEDQFIQVLSTTGFYPEVTQWFENGGDYGFGSLSVYKKGGRVRFKAENVFQILFDEDDSKDISEVAFMKTVLGSELLTQFGEKKAIQVINELNGANLTSLKLDTLDATEILYLNQQFQIITMYIKTGSIWKEYCVDKKSQIVLRDQTLQYQPNVIFRMERGSSMYGRGWGKKNLERAITLDQIKHDASRASSWAVDPVWQANDDGMTPPQINPGDILFGDLVAGDVVRPVPMQTRPEYALQYYEMEREATKKSFKLDSFDFQKKEKQSIAEISEFAGIRNVRVSRFLYRFFTEGLIPALKSAYYLALETGMIKKPDSIKNLDLQLDFISPLFAQQRYSKVTNLSRAFQASAPAFEVDPSTKHIIDGKKIASDIFSEFGLADKLKTTEQAEEAYAKEQEMMNRDVGSKSAKQSADAEKSLAQAQAIREGGSE